MIAPLARVLAILLAGVVVTAPAVLYAQGEHARRAGAELLVIQGDLRQLLALEVPAQKRARGLRDRIQGMLSSLPVLLRLADQERSREPGAVDAAGLRALLRAGDYQNLASRVASIARDYPFHTHHLLGVAPAHERLRRALATHRQLCAACHDFPYLDTGRPALNLYVQAKQLPPQEFAARMVIGIRGDVVTGLGNPFSDEELSVLIALYESVADSTDAERF